MGRASPLTFSLALLGLLGCSEPTRPSVVLVTLDTTRADHLSCYGYTRETSPSLDAFASKAVRFTRAWSTSSWTLPAHASLFTGLYPESHGAHFDADGDALLSDVVGGLVPRRIRVGSLSANFTTLAEILAQQGYRTGAFVAGPWLHRSFGLMQGFERVDDSVSSLEGRAGNEITDAAVDWLRGLEGNEPFFLFVNYFDAHAPYTPPPGFDDYPLARVEFDPTPVFDSLLAGTRTLDERERQVLTDRYDGEIRYMDHALGRLLHALRAQPQSAHTLVIITSDHGESLGEDGRYQHGLWLSEEIIRVPLVVRYPDGRGAGGVDETPVQLVDIPSLVLRELGIALGVGDQGRPLGRRRDAFANVGRNPLAASRYGDRYDRALEAVVSWPLKFVRSDVGDTQLFELHASGSERPRSQPHEARRLGELLDAHRTATPRAAGTRALVEPDTYRALRDLGYVE